MRSEKGIKDILKEEAVLTRTEFAAIRQGLLDELSVPRLAFKGSPNVAYGDRLKIQIDRFPLPALDLYENTLVREKPTRGRLKIFATFPAVDGPLVVPAEYDSKTSELQLTVPKYAVEGPVTFRFPVKEYLGPPSLMKHLDPADDVFRQALSKYVPYQNASERCLCEVPKYDEETKKLLRAPCLPAPEPVEENDYESMSDHMEGNGLYMVNSVVLYPHCYIFAPMIGHCPICPHGAIEVDAFGNCRVNTDACLGQSVKIDTEDSIHCGEPGNSQFKRLEETICWDCFAEGDLQISTKCQKRKLKKVLHLGPHCCGICHSSSQTCDHDDIAAVCQFGVITPNTAEGPYLVDKSACTGCMECHEKISCNHNYSDVPQERALRMVAYLDWPVSPHLQSGLRMNDWFD